MEKRPKENRGFSLIELIIAIAILVILTGLLAPQFMKYIERARKAKCLNNQDVILEEYQVRMIDAENIHDIDDAKALMEEVISDIGAECPSGGIYEVKIIGGGKKRSADADEGWLELSCTKHGGDGEALSSNPVISKAQISLKQMQQFVGLTAEDILGIEDWKNIMGDSKIVFSNDKFREYLIKKHYGGTWPQFDSDVLLKNGFKEGTKLYIQSYMNCYNKDWSTVTNNNVIVFASSNSTSSGNWNASLIFHPEKLQWYKAPNNGSIGIGNRSWDDVWDEMVQKGWRAIE